MTTHELFIMTVHQWHWCQTHGWYFPRHCQVTFWRYLDRLDHHRQLSQFWLRIAEHWRIGPRGWLRLVHSRRVR